MNVLLALSPRYRKITAALGASLLLLAALVIFTMPNFKNHDISRSRRAALGLASQPSASWNSRSLAQGIVGGVPGGVPKMQFMSPEDEAITPDRQVIRTASMQVFSNDPAQTAARAEQLAQSLGGFVVNSTVSGGAREEQSANLQSARP